MNCKHLILALAFGAATLVLPLAASATDNGTASATIVTAVGVAHTSGGANLNFGTWVSGPATVVTVAPSDSSVSQSGSATQVNTAANAATAAAFSVTGTSGLGYTITLPTDDVTIQTGAGGIGNTMTVNNFQDNLTAHKGVIGTTDTFKVGADLTIGAGQNVGLYTGTFNVLIAYN